MLRGVKLPAMVSRILRSLGTLLDDVLPMPPDQREQRSWTPLSGNEVARRRRQRLDLHLLEKRGKGGFR